MHSWWVKLLLGFALVTLVAVGMVALAANVVTARQFDRYLRWGGEIRAQRLAPFFAEYYARTGSWEGVNGLLDRLSWPGMRRQMGQQLPAVM
jgi:hypothetical protein